MVKTHEAVAAADIVVLLVDHNQFRTLPRKLLDGKVVMDTRGIWR
jgi:UDP-N-acetyl-D-mannosaminuronic acid dehydrogenase